MQARARLEKALVSSWPWMKDAWVHSDGSGYSLPEATAAMEDWYGMAVGLFGAVAVSLAGGVVASARLLGLRTLAKQMLIITNMTTAVFGFAAMVLAVIAYNSGYGWAAIAGGGLLGFASTGIGAWGFVGAYTERAGVLKLQMCVTLPTTVLLIIFGLECSVRNDEAWRAQVHRAYDGLRQSLGLVRDCRLSQLHPHRTCNGGRDCRGRQACDS
eukprot:SAG31_NODE_4222_length_3448_cov_5.365184_2_plen_214_part_00